MKVLVTGGAGYIGSTTVRHLIAQKHNPIIFDDLSTGHKNFIPKKALFVKGDLKKLKDITGVFKKYRVDAVMHFAASALVGESVQDPLKYYRNNVQGALNLLAAMNHAGVNKIIVSSTCAIYGAPKRLPIREQDPKDPANPYGSSKLAVENLLKDISDTSNLRYISLRYFNACGAHPDGGIGEDHEPETHLIPNILKVLTGEKKELTIFGDDYPTPDGTCVRDYVHVEDLASAHLLALKALSRGMKSDVFNLGSGKGCSVKEIVRMVEKVTGKKVKVRVAPRRPGDPPTLVASPAKANKVLGWKPRYGLEEIIRTAWEWEQSR